MTASPGAIPRRLGLLIAVGVAYYVGARLGLQLSLVESNVTPLWPPTGIALAAFVLLGRSLWPAVAVAAFLVNLPISENLLAAGATAVGNVLAPLIAALLLERFGFRRQLDRARDAYLIVFVAALGSMLVSATIGALTLVGSGVIEADGFLAAWAVWWTGDAMGVLVVAPFLLAIPLFWELPRWSARQMTEALAIAAVAPVVVIVGVNADLPVLFPVLPALCLVAWRLQLRGVAPAALTTCVATAWVASHGDGLFSEGTLFQQMLTLQGFNACVALSSFFVAALVTARMRTDRELVEREHEIVESLQRTLLPDRLPVIPGVDLAARYVPATSDVQVGGDWYDVVRLPGGLIGLAIGDVAGHGLAAASAMGQLRMALRAYALQDPSPASVMAGLHALVEQVPDHPMATVFYLVFDPETRQVRYANAGHPPALWVGSGAAAYLTEALSPPVGVSQVREYPEATVELTPGALLVLYTDGLVERRGVSIQQGLDQLDLAARGRGSDDVEGLCATLLDVLLDGVRVEDDVALLVLRVHGTAGSPMRVTMPAEPRALGQVRRAMRRWMRENGIGDAVADEILVASSEACTNVVEHAYAAAPGTLEVEVGLVGGAVQVVVRDEGSWRPEADRGGGWGLELTRALMDTVEVRGRDEGTEVVMQRAVRNGGVG